MEKKVLIIISLNFLILISIAIIIITNSSTFSPVELEECKTLRHYDEGNINLVFFSSKEQAEIYSEELLNTNPMKDYKKKFNIYYIDSYKPECELYKGKAILCYNREIIKKASSCPNDFITVIQKENQKIRSSAYMNVMSINSRNSLNVISHEFGHVLADLADEYTPAVLPSNSKNCVKDCEDFDLKDGCYKGCSKEDHYRSIDSGIMRTLNSNFFGVFNEKIIKDKISQSIENQKSKITGHTIEGLDCFNEEYVLIEGKYSENKIEINEKSVEKGCIEGGLGSGSFGSVLVFEDGSTKKSDFNPNYIFTDAEGDILIDGGVFESEKEFYLKIPLRKTKTLEIEKQNQTLIKLDITDITTKSRPCKNE